MISQYDKYQTAVSRFFALIADGLVLIPLMVINYAIRDSNLSPVALHLWILLMTLLPLLYTILFHALYGQTFGKMIVKVKVVDLDENPITFNHAVLRSLPKIFFSFIVIFFSRSQEYLLGLMTILYVVWTILDIIVFFVNDKRRALHDFIAGTVVIRLD